MFLTNPYMARRGISVPMDLAFPAKPAVSPGEEGSYRSSVCCRSPGYCRGWSCACAKPARPPPCPALPCPAPRSRLSCWNGSASSRGAAAIPVRAQHRGAACPCPVAAPPGLGAGLGWTSAAACPLPFPGLLANGKAELRLDATQCSVWLYTLKILFLVLDRDDFCG